MLVLCQSLPSVAGTDLEHYDHQPLLACPTYGYPERTPAKHAYVTIHYEGTPADAEYVLGTRVLLKSLQDTGTTADLVVLASRTVSNETIKRFCDDGVIVEVVDDIPNPFAASVLPRFLLTLNKLHLWRMTRYEKVVYLDADNIAMRQMDDLFTCGRLCVVFMNPCHFHTGLIVVKPDYAEFERLLVVLETDPLSHDGADQGFLSYVYGEQAIRAPLFVGNESWVRQDDPPVMRLLPAYNMHHLYDMETNSWQLFALHGFTADPESFFSITYPITPLLKPWNYVPYAFLHVHWLWLERRMALGEDFSAVIAPIVVIPLLCHVLLLRILSQVLNNPRAVSSVLRTAPLLRGVGSTLVGLVAVVGGIMMGARLVPLMLPPHYGWALIFYLINGWVYTVVRALRLVTEEDSVQSSLISLATPFVTQAAFLGMIFASPIDFFVGHLLGLFFLALASAWLLSRAVSQAADTIVMEWRHRRRCDERRPRSYSTSVLPPPKSLTTKRILSANAGGSPLSRTRAQTHSHKSELFGDVDDWLPLLVFGVNQPPSGLSG